MLLVGVYFLHTNSPCGFSLVGIVAEKMTWLPIGRPKVQSGSGKENLKIYVSDVILIFLANFNETFWSLSFDNLCKAPPDGGTKNDSSFLFLSLAAFLALA